MDELLLSYIDQIIAKKVDAALHPTHATYLELLKHVNSELNNSLNRLFKNNKIEVGGTINDKWIKIR